MRRPTYIIRRQLVKEALGMRDCISTIEEVFRLYGQGRVQMPPKVYLSFEKGDLRCMPAYIPSMKMAGVKNVNVHPGNKGMPTVMATITLIDPENGFPLAIMDGTYITNMRTGAAGGVAAKCLSRKNSVVAAFIGTGVQARTQLEALMLVRPKISKVLAYSTDAGGMKKFAEEAKTKYGIEATCANSVNGATRNADIVVTTTPARSPMVMNQDIREGVHINAIGADAPGKEELDPRILKRAKVVIDNWEQSSHGGEINVPFSKGVITKGDIHGDIGEIVTGKKGRTSDSDITVFDSTGLAIQDLSVAAMAFRKLMGSRRLRLRLKQVDLLGLS